MQNADQSLAEAWDNSAAAREEMGEQPGMIRRAVGLGRSLLDPLPVLASLCGAPRGPHILCVLVSWDVAISIAFRLLALARRNYDVADAVALVACRWLSLIAPQDAHGDTVLSVSAGSGGELLAMKLHPLQQYLPKDDVLQVAEQTLMTVVNQARILSAGRLTDTMQAKCISARDRPANMQQRLSVILIGMQPLFSRR